MPLVFPVVWCVFAIGYALNLISLVRYRNFTCPAISSLIPAAFAPVLQQTSATINRLCRYKLLFLQILQFQFCKKMFSVFFHISVIRLPRLIDREQQHLLAHSLLIEFVTIGVFCLLLQNHRFQKKINVFVPCHLFCSETFYIIRKQAGIWMIEVFDNTAVIIHAQNIKIFRRIYAGSKCSNAVVGVSSADKWFVSGAHITFCKPLTGAYIKYCRKFKFCPFLFVQGCCTPPLICAL